MYSKAIVKLNCQNGDQHKELHLDFIQAKPFKLLTHFHFQILNYLQEVGNVISTLSCLINQSEAGVTKNISLWRVCH